MAIEKPSFFVNPSLRNFRKLKRYGAQSVLEANDLLKDRQKVTKKLNRMLTVSSSVYDKIDLTENKTEKRSKKRLSQANMLALNFDAKKVSSKLSGVRAPTRLLSKVGHQSNVTKTTKRKPSYNKLNTIGRCLSNL
jgi:hypothetical protein